MGSKSSKVASKAAGAAGRRQYPSTSSILNSTKSTANAPSVSNPPPAAQVHPSPELQPPSSAKSEHVDLDARDPHFGSALRQAGIARRVPQHSSAPQVTFPTSSMPPAAQQAPGQQIFPSKSASTNPAIAIVQARERIAKHSAEENDSLGRRSFEGRTLLSAREIKEALRLRDEGGKQTEEIEKLLRLRSGILGQLGARGVVANA